MVSHKLNFVIRLISQDTRMSRQETRPLPATVKSWLGSEPSDTSHWGPARLAELWPMRAQCGPRHRQPRPRTLNWTHGHRPRQCAELRRQGSHGEISGEISYSAYIFPSSRHLGAWGRAWLPSPLNTDAPDPDALPSLLAHISGSIQHLLHNSVCCSSLPVNAFTFNTHPLYFYLTISLKVQWLTVSNISDVSFSSIKHIKQYAEQKLYEYAQIKHISSTLSLHLHT